MVDVRRLGILLGVAAVVLVLAGVVVAFLLPAPGCSGSQQRIHCQQDAYAAREFWAVGLWFVGLLLGAGSAAAVAMAALDARKRRKTRGTPPDSPPAERGSGAPMRAPVRAPYRAPSQHNELPGRTGLPRPQRPPRRDERERR